MENLNPNALLLIAIATVAGFLAGSWAWGCLAGLLLVLAAGFAPGATDSYDRIVRRARRANARRRP